MSWLRKLFLYFIFLYAVTISATDLRNTNFKRISTEHGLSQKTVQAIYQDSVGYLWFGTQEGLNRYDGREIRIFRHSAIDKKSISHDYIKDIQEDSSGHIWVATSSGLNKFNAASETFEVIELSSFEDEKVLRLNTLFLDSNGTIWVGTDGNGVFFLEKASRGFAQYQGSGLLNKSDVRSIFEDSRGRMWFGTDGDGAVLATSESTKQFLSDSNDTGSISHNRIRDIYEDSKGKIWLGTRGGGLNQYNEISKSFRAYKANKTNRNSLTHDRVYQIFEDQRRVLWIATDGGISIYNPESDDFTQIVHKPSQQSSLSHNRVLTLYQDRGGMMWFGTLAGLNQWNPYTSGFSHFRQVIEDEVSLSNNMVYALTEDNNGNVYIGTFGGGLNVYDKNANFVGLAISPKKQSELVIRRIMSLMEDNEKNLWIGSISQGIEVLSPSKEKLAHYKFDSDDPKSLSANGVTDIFQDSDGDIWVTTYRGGLNFFDKKNKNFLRFKRDPENQNNLINESLYQIMEDDEGYLWVASDGGGISRFDKKNKMFVHVTSDPTNSFSLSSNNVLSIYQDTKGRFWIGTQGNGLNRWEPEDRRKGINTFHHYTVDNGLNSSTVYGVLEDEKGFIWASTTRGLNKINPLTHEIEHYNLADEVHYNEFNQGAFLKTGDGQMFFGGTQGVSAFYPDEIVENPNVPNVVLTKISSENNVLLFEDALTALKEVTFDHNDYLISFEFAALDYAQPDKNRYQYKLDGLDNEWIDIGHFNRAIFTNLPSGTYRLRIRGSNSSGIWSEDEVNLTVNILPAPWFSWWAFTFYAMAFSLLLIFLIRLQAKRLASQEVFQSLVSEKVNEKTKLYSKNTDFLNARLEQFKNKTNVDLETGLANQKYLSELVYSLLSWVNCNSITEVENQFTIVLIRLPKVSESSIDSVNVYNRAIKQIAYHIRETRDRNTLVVRWSERDLGLMELQSNNQEKLHQSLESLTQEIGKLFEIASEQNANLTVNLSYALAPIMGVNQNFFDGDRLLMLVEHILHILENQSDISVAGLEKINQIMSETLFNQVLEYSSIDDFEKVFELYKK